MSGTQLRKWIYLRAVKQKKSHSCSCACTNGTDEYYMSIGLPSSASSRSGTMEALPILNPLSDLAFSFHVFYNLEINLPLSVTRAAPLGLLQPGRGRLRFPRLEAATRASALPPLGLALGQSSSRVQTWPADDTENRARVWENSLSESSQDWR